MDTESAKKYLLNKTHSQETFPFGPDVAVYKVKAKMFATLAIEKGEGRMNLKCEPHEALLLREMFNAVKPGYHMNKKHWNTVHLDHTIPQGEIERMIDNSFKLVVAKMTKKDQLSILIHL